MTKLPAELQDAERREDEPVTVTLARAGHLRAVTLPRWVAAFIEEATGMLARERQRVRDERAGQFRHWWAGWLAGAGAFAAGIRPWLGIPLTIAAVTVQFWPNLKAKWDDWRGR